MKLMTEMTGPDSTSSHPYPACKDDGQGYLHDAAAAHAMWQAIKKLEEAHCYGYMDEIRGYCDELMREWGYAEE